LSEGLEEIYRGNRMNPLSTWTFYLRHKRRAALLLGLIGLVTVGLYLLVALSWAIFIEPMRANYMILSKLSVVMPGIYLDEPDPTVAAQIRSNPDVAQVIPAYSMQIALPEVMGGGSEWFFLMGVMQENIPYLMERCGATLKEGQMLEPRTNGIMLSDKVAANLGLQIGDTIHSSTNPEYFGNILSPLEVVGILESDVRMGVMSYEYLESHELYQRFPPSFLVVAHAGREVVVDNFLREEIAAGQTFVLTHQWLAQQMAIKYRNSYVLLLPIITIVAIAITFVIGIANHIEFSRRLSEFGLLHAAGYSRRWLVRRLTMETATLACIGWGIGLGLSWIILSILKLAVFAPTGHELTILSLAPALLVTPVPIAMTGITLIGVRRIFSRLDPVALVERGELSQEGDQRQATTLSRSKSSLKPLASLTYFRRHQQRAILLISAMGLMIIAVVLAIFLLATTEDAQTINLSYLRLMSRVSSGVGSSLHPGVITQLKAHPSVDRIIPIAPRIFMLGLLIPGGGEANASPFGVYASDMAYLVEIYQLELEQGHLPRPHTNEIVISEIVAQNRDLKVGDVLGNPDHPAYPGAPDLPVEFVISGIFARSTSPLEENLLGFASLEFMESHAAFDISGGHGILVIPKVGQKAAMDNWLENELAGKDVSVFTYRQQLALARERTRSLLLTITLLESVIALVTAVALAVLNYISASQRQAEFGILHALGYSRRQLTWRTVREMVFITGAAWSLSALICFGGMLYLKFGLYTQLGLRLNLFNPTPWLFTLPIPIAVLAATSGTVSRILAKLDPVSIIERRSR
jgi:ABC-type lipoprotein release transport system permease subunit